VSGVAYDGLNIQQSIASGYISYTYRVWDDRFREICDTIYDEEGNPIGEDCYWVGGWRYFNDTADAIVNGSVIASSNGVYVNGSSVVTTSSNTSENWVSTPLKSEVVSVSPGTSGSGVGTVTFGNSSKVFANGSLVATNGSMVTTHLGTISQIIGGSTNVFIG
jgi:hypothetical protein